ncbi:hypothetical protein K6Y31_16835 [Motilimonas cestriensis]|uniref:Uncharacterized protein n=1 Tax=Motilimonas cestriensis TaxID=2742685 RepID=A0ABS8WFX2_9GAMM|nr:hypothetical protein [Motilimonas cestriensis]MCE2596464.1 hypothetical protein [Motilimonas cestriensis]
MAQFSISRLHTSQGIFRLTGDQGCNDPVNPESVRIEVETIDVMGTDGWVALDVKASKTQQLLLQIDPEIVSHLLT